MQQARVNLLGGLRLCQRLPRAPLSEIFNRRQRKKLSLSANDLPLRQPSNESDYNDYSFNNKLLRQSQRLNERDWLFEAVR